MSLSAVDHIPVDIHKVVVGIHMEVVADIPSADLAHSILLVAGILVEGIVGLVAGIGLAGMVVDMAAVDIEVEVRERDAYMQLEGGWVQSFD